MPAFTCVTFDANPAKAHEWRKTALLPRLNESEIAATYARATPLLLAMAQWLVSCHGWVFDPTEKDMLFTLRLRTTDSRDLRFALPETLALFRQLNSSFAAMFRSVFHAYKDSTGLLIVSPFDDLFYLLQLIYPGAFLILYAENEDDEDVDLGLWNVLIRGLPSAMWMSKHQDSIRTVLEEKVARNLFIRARDLSEVLHVWVTTEELVARYGAQVADEPSIHG